MTIRTPRYYLDTSPPESPWWVDYIVTPCVVVAILAGLAYLIWRAL